MNFQRIKILIYICILFLYQHFILILLYLAVLNMKILQQNLFFREKRNYLVISSQTSLHKEYRQVLHEVEKEEPRFLFIERCDGEERPWNFSKRCKNNVVYDYPQILQVWRENKLLFYCYQF